MPLRCVLSFTFRHYGLHVLLDEAVLLMTSLCISFIHFLIEFKVRDVAGTLWTQQLLLVDLELVQSWLVRNLMWSIQLIIWLHSISYTSVAKATILLFHQELAVILSA